MSGGKSAAPQVNGSKGSAPNKSLPRTTDHRFVRDHSLSRAAQIYEKIRNKRILKSPFYYYVTHLCLVVTWWVGVGGSRYWLPWASAVAPGRRGPCRRCPWIVVWWKRFQPAFRDTVKERVRTGCDRWHVGPRLKIWTERKHRNHRAQAEGSKKWAEQVDCWRGKKRKSRECLHEAGGCCTPPRA